MATISNPSFTVTNVNNTTVKLTVKYTLTPNNVEKLAGSVFKENVTVIGDDPGVVSDITVTAMPTANFAVSTGTGTVNRERIVNVLKSALNEDPGFLANGSELSDEIFARISLSYAANAPIPPALPAPLQTNTVSGAWK